MSLFEKITIKLNEAEVTRNDTNFDDSRRQYTTDQEKAEKLKKQRDALAKKKGYVLNPTEKKKGMRLGDKLEKDIDNNFSIKSAIIIGLFQVLSLIPGTSRSGIVITAGLCMGFSRFDASKYSLLLSIPVIIAATTLESINLFIEKGFFFNNEMIMGIILSFCVALITIRLFMKWINKASLKIFVAYRIMLGILILVYAYI